MKSAVPLAAALLVWGAASFAAGAAEPGESAAQAPAADHRAVGRLVAMIESSPGRCGRLPFDHPQRRLIEDDIARFRRLVPQAAAVRFDVLDCYWDGMVDRGERIVVSSRLARATPAQRFFVIAHEFGHFALGHHAAIVELVEDLLQAHDNDAEAVAQAIGANVAGAMSRRHEAQADAFATHATLLAGLEIEQAAHFFETQGQALKTHPAPHARAEAIRRLAATTMATHALAAATAVVALP
jgi:Zn-dependent protease with chaperone function